MERTLSLVLDDEGKKSLTLLKDDAVAIDKFIIKNFENSDQIREYYKDKIGPYLERNAAYIEEIKKSTNRNFRGRIVILEAHEKDFAFELVEKRVLYKKHIIAFNKLISDQKTLKRFLILEKIGINVNGFKKLVWPYLVEKINYSNYRVKSQVNIIKKEIKGSKNFYDILRIIVKAYNLERKTRPTLQTIDAIYKDYLKSIQFSVESNTEIQEDTVLINGDAYLIDRELYDLEDIIRMETNFKFDGVGDKNEKKSR